MRAALLHCSPTAVRRACSLLAEYLRCQHILKAAVGPGQASSHASTHPMHVKGVLHSPCMSWYRSLLAGLSPSLSLSPAACCSHSSAEEVPSVALLRPDSPTDSVRGIPRMPSARSAWAVPGCFHCSCRQSRADSG